MNTSIVERMKELLKRQQAEIERLRQQAVIPMPESKIVIVSMAFRLPGIENAADYWSVLMNCESTISDLPKERFSSEYSTESGVGRFYNDRGGFLANIDQFDHEYFGISRREAVAMDPQQRLLLMCAEESLESAGIDQELRKELTIGSYIGMMKSEYGSRLLRILGSDAVDFHHGTGSGGCFASGRLSYALGLRGPSLTIDTACSSSLTAFHLACQAVESGECDAALVGAANMILDPELNVALCQAEALSKTGRCYSFDHRADGYVRSEGVGTLLVMTEDRARTLGLEVLAFVRGSAINHGGKTAGLAVPGYEGQVDVIRKALTKSRLHPDEVAYVEAHGTGTRLGDPLEMRALETAYALKHRKQNLFVGAVKANIGHTEATAGLAGLIKIILMFRHATIPPLYDLKSPNPNIPWQNLKIEMNDKAIGLSRDATCGISSFGISGSNAHVLISGPGQANKSKEKSLAVASETYHPWLILSADSHSRLQDYARVILNTDKKIFTHRSSLTLLRRSLKSHVLVLSGADPETLVRNLKAWLTQTESASLPGLRYLILKKPQWKTLEEHLSADEKSMLAALREQSPGIDTAIPLCPYQCQAVWVDGVIRPMKAPSEMDDVQRAVEISTASTQIDTKRQPPVSRMSSSTSPEASWKKILQVFENVLESTVDPCKSFLENGGDSFTGMLIATQIQSEGLSFDEEWLTTNRPLDDLRRAFS